MSISINVNPILGSSILEVFARMVRLATSLDMTVTADINQVFIVATPRSRPAELEREFFRKLRLKNEQQEASAAKRAQYELLNPLGGPARMFDAMAERIRAGEDFHAVLDDYGFMLKPQTGNRAHRLENSQEREERGVDAQGQPHIEPASGRQGHDGAGAPGGQGRSTRT